MAQQYTEKELEEHYFRLPPELREALFSVENAQHIYNIGKKFGLNVEQIGMLAQESGYVVIGITHPENFATNLSKCLDIDLDKARAIATEVSHKIFYPLRELLKSTHQIDVTQEQINKPPIPTSPTPRPPIPPAPSTLRIMEIAPKPSLSIPATPTTPPSPKIAEPAQAPRPPLAPLPPSTIQQQKKVSSIPPIILSKLPGTSTETKSDIPPTTAPQPLAPSEVMQKMIFEQRGIQPLPHPLKMNEAIFAAPTTPQEAVIPPLSSKMEATPPVDRPAPQPIKPVPPRPFPLNTSSQQDPYREPIE